MGFWEEYARKTLPAASFRRASERQREYDRAIGAGEYTTGPGILGTIAANWRASRWANRYWNENDMINRVMSGRNNDLGHPPGCTCRFCFRGRIEQGRDQR